MTAHDFWLESDETFPAPQSSHFSLKSNAVDRRLEILCRASAASFQKYTKKEMEITEGTIPSLSLSLSSPLPVLQLYTRLLFPGVQTRAPASLQHVLTALKHEGGLEQEEPSVGFGSPSEPSDTQRVCQETCAMSLTRVWMSCRHRGHVSNCKAHSIHIPLRKREGQHQKTADAHMKQAAGDVPMSEYQKELKQGLTPQSALIRESC